MRPINHELVKGDGDPQTLEILDHDAGGEAIFRGVVDRTLARRLSEAGFSPDYVRMTIQSLGLGS
jgi:hypothetical protein